MEKTIEEKLEEMRGQIERLQNPNAKEQKATAEKAKKAESSKEAIKKFTAGLVADSKSKK